MKFFVPFDETLLRSHPQLAARIVPFVLDYPCYRGLKEGDLGDALDGYEILEPELAPEESRGSG